MTAVERPRKRLDRQTRRAQIIDAAIVVFDGREPASVTLEEIADAAGVSRALVYNYFGDRLGLVEAVHRHCFDQLRRQLNSALSSVRGRREAVGAVVRAHLRFASEHRLAYRYATELSRVASPGLVAQRIREFAALFGGEEEAELLATGVWAALPAMVSMQVDRPALEPARAAEVITSFMWSGLSSVGSLGLPVHPLWPLPSETGKSSVDESRQ